MAGMINAAAGTNRRMKEMDEMTGAPPAKPAPVAAGAVKKPPVDMTPMAPPPGMIDRVKSAMGFGAKKEK